MRINLNINRCMALLAVALLAAAVSARDYYRLLYINQGHISVGVRQLEVGDSLDGSAPIKWENQRQAIKVLDLQTGRQIALSARQLDKSRKNSILSYFESVNHLSTRDLDHPLSHTEICLIDSVQIDPEVDPDMIGRYTLSYRQLGQNVEQQLTLADGCLTICRDIFGPMTGDYAVVDILGYFEGTDDPVVLVEDLTVYLPDD